MSAAPPRPDWDAWALGIAEAVARRGDCTRRRVGAVVLDVRHRIIGAGYNGTRPGGPSCLAGGCPRGRHFRLPESYGKTCSRCPDSGWHCPECVPLYRCACGKEWRPEVGCGDAVAPGSSYDTGPGVCIASHAEINCLMDVEARYRLDGATMYVTEEPCDGCLKIVANSTRLAAIVWPVGAVVLA